MFSATLILRHGGVLERLLGQAEDLVAVVVAALGLEPLAVDEDAAIGQRALAAQRLDQRRLAVAGDAGDADDLAGLDLEVDLVDRGLAVVVVGKEATRARARRRR